MEPTSSPSNNPSSSPTMEPTEAPITSEPTTSAPTTSQPTNDDGVIPPDGNDANSLMMNYWNFVICAVVLRQLYN